MDITGDVVWNRAGSPYLVSRDVEVKASGSLTMEPGTVVKFSGLLGHVEVLGGNLTAVGTANRPIVWTSINDDSVMGDSNGSEAAAAPGDYGAAVVFYNDALDPSPSGRATGEISNVSQRFGAARDDNRVCSYGAGGVLINDYSRVHISHSEFILNHAAGVTIRDSADAEVRNSRFASSGCGVRTDGTGDVIDNVFEADMLSSFYSGGPRLRQTVAGNWMYSGLDYNAAATREQIDVHDNAILGHQTSNAHQSHPPVASDLEYNWWGAHCRVPGVMEALIPRKDESHGSTEEVSRGTSGAGDPDGGRPAA